MSSAKDASTCKIFLIFAGVLFSRLTRVEGINCCWFFVIHLPILIVYFSCWVLQYYRVQPLADRRRLWELSDRALPADRGTCETDGGLLLPAEGRLRVVCTPSSYFLFTSRKFDGENEVL